MKPEFPAAAKEQTDAGVVAFVEYYWASLDYALAKPDSDILEGLASADCQACVSMQDAATTLAKEHQHYDGRTLESKSSEIVYNTEGRASVLSRIDFLEVNVVDAVGTVQDTVDAESATRVLTLKWSGAWQVISLAEG